MVHWNVFDCRKVAAKMKMDYILKKFRLNVFKFFPHIFKHSILMAVT